MFVRACVRVCIFVSLCCACVREQENCGEDGRFWLVEVHEELERLCLIVRSFEGERPLFFGKMEKKNLCVQMLACA